MHFTTVLLSAVLGAFSVTASPVPDEVLALEARAGKTVSYDCGPSGTPQICLNICWAVHCRGLPEDLHGGGGAAAVKNHRTEWGYGYETKWKQYQWNNQACTSPDEYPYASSKEGGLDGAGKTLALRCVPSVEQSRECILSKNPDLICELNNNVREIKMGLRNADMICLTRQRPGRKGEGNCYFYQHRRVGYRYLHLYQPGTLVSA